MDASHIAPSAQAALCAAVALAAGNAALVVGTTSAETVVRAAVGLLVLAVAAVTPRSVSAVLESWRPAGLGHEDLLAVAAVLPVVRVWVAAAAPGDPSSARTLLWATTRLAVWAHLTLGSVDPTIVLDPHNVQHFTVHVNARRSPHWRHVMRSALARVGRAANPQGWAPSPPQAGRSTPAAPYGTHQEQGFILEAQLPGRPHRAARMFVVGASACAGRSGPEIHRARVEDRVDLRDDRVGLRIEGCDARPVPVRAAYTEVVREAAAEAGTEKFVTAESRNAVHSIAERLTKEGLSLPRARNTRLVAHVAAGTPLAALKDIAGSLSMDTLDALIPAVSASLTPEEAAEQGLAP